MKRDLPTTLGALCATVIVTTITVAVVVATAAATAKFVRWAFS